MSTLIAGVMVVALLLPAGQQAQRFPAQPLPAASDGVTVELVEPGVSWTSRERQAVAYEWEASVRNPNDTAAVVSVVLLLHDRSDQVLFWDDADFLIAPGDEKEIDGTGIVSEHTARQASYWTFDVSASRYEPAPVRPEKEEPAETTDPNRRVDFGCDDFERVFVALNPKLEDFKDAGTQAGVGADLSGYASGFEEIANGIPLPSDSRFERAGDLLWSAVQGYANLAEMWKGLNLAGIQLQLEQAREALEGAVQQLRAAGCSLR